MSMFGQNGPVFLKTYGRQKRKIEQWFSPDLRKKAFSFSSTSSEQSSTETTCPRKRLSKNKASAGFRTSRLAKKRALKALKDLASDEENVFPLTTPRMLSKRTMSSKCTRKTTVIREPSGRHTKRKKEQPVLINSESEIDSFVTKDTCYKHMASSSSTSISLPSKGRFVTHRKRVTRVQSEKPTCEQSFGFSSSNLKISKGSVCVASSLPDHVTKPKQHPKKRMENSKSKPSGSLIDSSLGQSVINLEEVSVHDCEEPKILCKLPMLCSTPALFSRQNQWYHEPSISEISSFSCDELETSAKSRPTQKELIRLQMRSEQWSNRRLEMEAVQDVEECVESVQQQRLGERRAGMPEGQVKEEIKSCKDDQTSTDTKVVSASIRLGSQVQQSKKRCPSVRAATLSQDDVFIMPSEQSNKSRREAEPTPSENSATSQCQQNFDLFSLAFSDTRLKPHPVTSSFCPSSSSSSSSLSVPVFSASSPSEPSSAQLLIDRLKIECLSSCLTVHLQPLDRSTLTSIQKETKSSQAVCPQFLETEQSLTDMSPHSRLVRYGSTRQTRGLVKRLSASFMLPAVSPSPIKASNKVHLTVVSKERNGSGASRRACVRGLSGSRWLKRGVGARNRKQWKNRTTSSKLRENSLNYMLPAGTETDTGDSTCGWLQGDGGLAMTPLKVERLNLSSVLANFTPDSLTTQTWGRLKAALSVHKKKTVSRKSAMDNSQDVFSTPMTSDSFHLLLSTMSNTSMSHYDISDAEKVYQECEQDGPLSFDKCIPPERMKHCVKIGEGTFGEVFSTTNNANETVALKIIPVEGNRKVNGEPQKTFAEILHEIIISKELSMLDSKENNKTNGFISLNELHCVRGCYPSTLLRAWDKFYQHKGSDNDRPDFFGEEQLFLILEFEFGGSDLENMNGKLSSLAQAKSILHQVTTSLAVAEQALCFEHRDLHWGNILVKRTKEKQNNYILNGTVHSVETRGIHVNVIDYSLSRLEIDGLTVSCDISNDEELFVGHGDYQFEIYRLMKKENNNSWGEYNPHSNVLWLHYLADKLLTMRYKTKVQTSQQKALQSHLKAFHSEILDYKSATDALLHCSLFR